MGRLNQVVITLFYIVTQMKVVEYISKVEVYDGPDELNAADRSLWEHSIKAAETAYAPYSQFHVGAAVRLANNEIVYGNNQENAAYPSGMCAERVALFHVNAIKPQEIIEAIAVTAMSIVYKTDQPITPCGGCLQVMAEMEKKQKKPIRVILCGSSGTALVSASVSQLLPLQFALIK